MLIISIGWYESGAVGTEQLTPCDLETGGRVIFVIFCENTCTCQPKGL